ncbi:hypothetical protein BU23DRAFT_568437 [Bimuria novae-zelandiae CBS 107.79]|uniref:Uncharacterized protein n=1 Tax=Bimuria novae-zelandiae CBS 107.79 TaxID=1447943 RepID=A0A6A5V7P4_9PLEO|nr:hypothetical protein BU23DRAFT_568437 [Bimuria novae-zelandiae CBS 107.79]
MPQRSTGRSCSPDTTLWPIVLAMLATGAASSAPRTPMRTVIMRLPHRVTACWGISVGHLNCAVFCVRCQLRVDTSAPSTFQMSSLPSSSSRSPGAEVGRRSHWPRRTAGYFGAGNVNVRVPPVALSLLELPPSKRHRLASRNKSSDPSTVVLPPPQLIDLNPSNKTFRLGQDAHTRSSRAPCLAPTTAASSIRIRDNRILYAPARDEYEIRMGRALTLGSFNRRTKNAAPCLLRCQRLATHDTIERAISPSVHQAKLLEVRSNISDDGYAKQKISMFVHRHDRPMISAGERQPASASGEGGHSRIAAPALRNASRKQNFFGYRPARTSSPGRVLHALLSTTVLTYPAWSALERSMASPSKFAGTGPTGLPSGKIDLWYHQEPIALHKEDLTASVLEQIFRARREV